jgi:hypothetical protein
MSDPDYNYDLMPVERVDAILHQLWPDYWTAERLRGASASDKREALRKASTGRARREVRSDAECRRKSERLRQGF